MVGKNQIKFIKIISKKKIEVKYRKIIVEGTKTIN